MDAAGEKAQFSKAAAKAVQDACTYLGYISALSGEIACHVYGDSRLPTMIEAVILMPGIKYQDRPSLEALKRSIAASNAKFFMPRTSLSYIDSKYEGQFQNIPIELTIATGFSESDIQPMRIIDGLQYASIEFVLSTRLSVWYKLYISTTQQPADSQEILQPHRVQEIDTLLLNLVLDNFIITKWHLFGFAKVEAYCKCQPSSVPFWTKAGFKRNSRTVATAPVVSPSPSTSSSHAKEAATSSASSQQLTPPFTVTTASLLSALTPSTSKKAMAIPNHASSQEASPSSAPPPYQPLPPTTPATATPKLPSADPSHPAPGFSTLSKILTGHIKNPTHIQMIFLAAQRAVDILRSIRLPSAIFGGLACFLYGNTRSPNDVDILVLPPKSDQRTIEDVKATLALRDPEHFFLLPSRDAGHTILHYWVPTSDCLAPSTPLTSCKVDLVFPGTLSLPNVDLGLINWEEGLPVIPFELVVLQKLQAWDHHWRSKMLKQWTDVEDMRRLFGLDLMERLKLALEGEEMRDGGGGGRLFSWTFLEATRVRVGEICREYPWMRELWRGVGFVV